METIVMIETEHKMVIVLVALYRNVNFPIRIMHSLLENIDGISPYSIFMKDLRDMVNYNFEPPTKEEEGLFVKQIIELNPNIIGISVLFPFAPIARRLTKLIRDNSSALVIWGGVYPTISPETCIEETDIICIGEGEGAIAELAINLRDGKEYFNIDNLWINNNGHIIKNNMRPLIQNLDSLPFPSYGKDSFFFIENNKLTKQDQALMESTFYVQTSRGCPYTCSYCCNSKLKLRFRGLGNYTRSRSVENVMLEIKEHQVIPNMHEYIYFVDEVFAINEPWLDKFELRYKKEVGLPFYVMYHPELVNPMILNKLVKSGLFAITMGIQSGSEYIRKHIFRRPGSSIEIIRLANEIATNYNVKIAYDLILDNPYDTEDTLKETIKVLMQLPKPLSVNMYSLQFYGGHSLTLQAIKDGHISEKDASVENLIEKKAWRMIFVPKLIPYTHKQMLQNIIWLLCRNYTTNEIIESAVFGNSFGSKVLLNYINLKAIILGFMKEILTKYIWISRVWRGLTYILKGDIATLYHKIRKVSNKGTIYRASS
jgi:anaerobic magnesium-protoporphyrin IX monomethyl ester cyclase